MGIAVDKTEGWGNLKETFQVGPFCTFLLCFLCLDGSGLFTAALYWLRIRGESVSQMHKNLVNEDSQTIVVPAKTMGQHLVGSISNKLHAIVKLL